MTHDVVIGFDGSEGAEDALKLGAWIAAAVERDPIVVSVYQQDVVPVLPGIGSEWDDEMRTEARQQLDRARRLLGDQARGTTFRAVGGTSAARALDAVATETNASGIVVGSSRRGALRRVSSSHTADRLLQGAPCPVLVTPRSVRDRDLPPLTEVGCAYLPTPEGSLALRQAAAVARRSGARLKVYTVPSHGPGQPSGRAQKERAKLLGERLMESATEALAHLPGHPEGDVEVLGGNVVEALSALEPEDCQILVCGSRGYGPVGRVLLGGVSSRLVRSAATPVLVVPRDAKEPARPVAE